MYLDLFGPESNWEQLPLDLSTLPAEVEGWAVAEVWSSDQKSLYESSSVDADILSLKRLC